MSTFSSIILEITVATKSKKTHGVGKVDEKQLITELVDKSLDLELFLLRERSSRTPATKMTGVVIFPPGKNYTALNKCSDPQFVEM